ncbi:uncharacterized protein BXZ73DRAFT_80024 [Epithele typhae]|uniref:uncharacterized protein n=1 Tax=Epithele typhae TaxID=378194 RepID=UPI0020076C7D|nr:uncharacterized protein BXZ73DRAFT_80024 [Epithele typhae]KAH9921260.1 hypothetical protein BXZ73DRAFT_80024 [Epithele typhae]
MPAMTTTFVRRDIFSNVPSLRYTLGIIGGLIGISLLGMLFKWGVRESSRARTAAELARAQAAATRRTSTAPANVLTRRTSAAPAIVLIAPQNSSANPNATTGSQASTNWYHVPIPVSVTRPPMANASQARHTGVPSLTVHAGAHPHVHGTGAGIGGVGEDGQHARTHEDDCATCRQIRELQRQHETRHTNDGGIESPSGSVHARSNWHSPDLDGPPVVASPSPRRDSEGAFSPADRLSHIASVAAEAFPDVPPLLQSPPSAAPPPRRSTSGAVSPPPPFQGNDAPPAYTPIASP